MTGPRPQGRINQVFFGWNQHQGGQAVLAHSFDRPDQHVRWLHRLQTHIRLLPIAGADLPDTALSYFLFEDNAVLLRRVNAGVTAGRNYSHALIGPAVLLTPQAALGMSFWKCWLDDPPGTAMEPLPERLIVDAVKTADERLLKPAVANLDVLVPILAGLLTDPRAPISVIGCPEDLKPAMIWALLEIAGRSLTDLPEPTFSTYEDRHDEGLERAPQILFLPVRPYPRAEVRRTIVDLERPDAGAPDLETARRLSQQLLNPTRAPEPPVIVNDPPRKKPAPPPTPQVPVAPPSLEQRLVAALGEPHTLAEFDRALDDLQRMSREQRRLVRSALDPAALDAAALRIEVAFREDLLRRLLAAAYGPELEDLLDPKVQKHAVEVVRSGGSEQIAMVLGASEVAARSPIPHAALQRWTADARPARPEPVARLARRLRFARHSRYVPVAALAAVLAILGMTFLGGMLLGRTDEDRSAVGAPPAPAQAPAAPPAARIAGGFTTINGVNPADVTVVAFVKAAGATVKPQGPCLIATGNTWFCSSRGDLPPGQSAVLVAYAVPKDRADDVLAALPARAPAPEWGTPHEVR